MSRLPKRPLVDHAAAAARLRANPGVWLPVGEYRSRCGADDVTRSIRTGAWSGRSRWSPYAPAGSFEARMDLTEFGIQIIARFIGSEGATDA